MLALSPKKSTMVMVALSPCLPLRMSRDAVSKGRAR